MSLYLLTTDMKDTSCCQYKISVGEISFEGVVPHNDNPNDFEAVTGYVHLVGPKMEGDCALRVDIFTKGGRFVWVQIGYLTPKGLDRCFEVLGEVDTHAKNASASLFEMSGLHRVTVELTW
jgi:hypothetical protein